MLSEARDLTDTDRPRQVGLLDRIPGWVVLAVVAAIIEFTLVFTTWQ